MPARVLAEAFTEIKSIAAQTGQRPLLWLAGDSSLAYAAAAELIALASDPELISDTHSASIVWVSRSFADINKFSAPLLDVLRQGHVVVPAHRSHLLGTQSDMLIYDAYAGFDPDLFCLAVGSVRSGGLVLLLAPEPRVWRQFPDPDYQRMLVYPYALSDVACRFMARVVEGFLQSPVVTLWNLAGSCWEKSLATGLPHSHPTVGHQRELSYTADQQALIRLVLEGVENAAAACGDQAPVPLVVTADRGRGKSAAIGAAIAALKERQPGLVVWITAPHKDNVSVLFDHCARQMTCDPAESGVSYLAPDDVVVRLAMAQQIASAERCDVLVVDEAAGIPDSLLQVFIHGAPCTVMATTVHGYEGTGRGFEIRLRPKLQASFPECRWLTLCHPIRWGDHDVLEACLNDVFLLGTNHVADYPGDVSGAALTVRELSQDELALPSVMREQRGWLASVFHLLMQAHYRTSPGDLRDLMDGLNLRLFVLLRGGQLVGCCLVALEGDLPPALITQIYQGKRRPRGHLLPQTLCQCLGFCEPASVSCARIVRIAVNPSMQGRGLGSWLLARVEGLLRQSGVALIGSSFSAFPDVTRFWRANGYVPARMGFTREASSGANALLVVKALNEDVIGSFVQRVTTLFNDSFTYLRSNELCSLPDALVDVFNAKFSTLPLAPISCSDHDWWLSQAQGFVAGYRTFEDSRYALWCVLQQAGIAPRVASLKSSERAILQALFEQDICIKMLRHSPWRLGKKQAVALLRRSFQQLL